MSKVIENSRGAPKSSVILKGISVIYKLASIIVSKLFCREDILILNVDGTANQVINYLEINLFMILSVVFIRKYGPVYT